MNFQADPPKALRVFGMTLQWPAAQLIYRFILQGPSSPHSLPAKPSRFGFRETGLLDHEFRVSPFCQDFLADIEQGNALPIYRPHCMNASHQNLEVYRRLAMISVFPELESRCSL